MGKSRIGELDYFRGLAIIAIVMQHLMGYIDHPQATPGDLAILSVIWHLINYGVPAFVLISGTALFYNYREGENLQYGKFITKRAKQILFPYLLWTIFYFFYDGLAANSSQLGLDILYYLFTGRAYYHLWFIVMIFQFYLLLPVFRKVFSILQEKVKTRLFFYILMLFIFSVQIVINWFYRYTLSSISMNMEIDGIFHNIYNYAYLLFILWTFYFILGGVIGLKYEASKECIRKVVPYNVLIWFCLFAYLLFDYSNAISLQSSGLNRDTLSLYHPYVAIFVASTIINVYQICTWLDSNQFKVISMLFRSIGKYSFSIYLAHPLIIDILNHQIYSISYLSPSFKFFLTAILTILIIIPGTVMVQRVLVYIDATFNFLITKKANVSK